MPNKNELAQSLKKHGVDDEIIEQVINVPYQKSQDDNQDTANHFCEAMKKCDVAVDFDVLSETMCEMSCCKTDSMLRKSRQFAKEHGDKSLEEKMKLLEHISQPWFIDDTHIESYITGEQETVCSCWNLKGHKPEDAVMPLSYCLCCAGFLRFHYQKSLGIKLRILKMSSSLLNGDKRCAVVFEIVSKT